MNGVADSAGNEVTATLWIPCSQVETATRTDSFAPLHFDKAALPALLARKWPVDRIWRQTVHRCETQERIFGSLIFSQ